MNLSGYLIKGSGEYTIYEASADDSGGIIKKGDKYLQCTNVAGTVAFPSKQAYGTWEFSLYKGGDVNLIVVEFLSKFIDLTINDGYRIAISNTEQIYLNKRISGSSTVLSNTVASYISNTTWYRIKIERLLNGQFSVYIKGGSFGTDDFTLVSVVGGSGTNPVTDLTYSESQYMVLDLDVSDRISNIKLTEGVIQ